MNVASSSPSSRKQKRLGPAPIASMEDTTAEEKAQMEQQNHHNLPRWSQEKCSIDSARGSPTKTFECASALIPATPRIDISRASSHSSHHDSRDSSPENVFEQVGTGTLQDSGVLGFREEDTLDLRNSTEELQFMEPEKGNREKEKPNTQITYGSCPTQRYSPIIWKLEEQTTQPQYQFQQQQQHNRKDSASSEVVAFLSISGRTSRLSSVGSQGSANSKLSATSAVSGISRSPSPHKMLLETSFCGAKPMQAYSESGIVGSSLEPSTEKMLEQVILSRKKDPTEAVLAEGIHMNTFTAMAANSTLDGGQRRALPAAVPQQPPPGGGDFPGVEHDTAKTEGHVRRKSDCGTGTTNNLDIQALKSNQTSRSVGNKRHIPPQDLKNSIVGVMPSGTEYIRIKLKPDHCYSDNGIADNERVVEKPKDGAQELSVSSAHDPHRTRASSITRSPSPANQHLPRKKRTSTASNESGTLGGRYYDQQMDHPSASTNSTPSKQKLVLKMFKSKRDPKSKSPSPMGSAAECIGQSFYSAGSGEHHIAASNIGAARSPGSTGLRYYDAPLDGQSIHIPLHTPPEERRLGSFRSAAGVTTSSFVDTAATACGGAQVSVSASGTPTGHSSIIQKHAKTPKQQRIANMTVTIHDRPKPMPPLKCYRIDNPDGSIIIPLKSPIEDKENSTQNWESVIGELSQRIEKHVSEDQDDSCITSPTGNQSATLTQNYADPSDRRHEPICRTTAPPPPPPPPPASRTKSPKPPVPVPTEAKASVDVDVHKQQQHLQHATTSSISTSMRQKQAALFQMRMGSGSEEQIFSTTLKDYSKEMNRNSSTVSQSSEGSIQKAPCGYEDRKDGSDKLVDSGTTNGGGGAQTRKQLAGKCSEHPNDLVTADSVTSSSSSPQQVMQAKGAMLMKELHEHQKQYQLRQQLQHQQQQQQQQREQLRDSNVAENSTEAITDASAAVVSRSSSPTECISSDAKHQQHDNHQHQQQKHHHHHIYRQKNHNHNHMSTTDRPDSSATIDDGMASSESEKDSEFDSASMRAGRHALRPNMLAIEDHESAGLVFQESFDDELPYIPTTLPEEKPVGIKLVPAKERTQHDLKTYPLERPRSTTPIHPGSLEKYCHDRSATTATTGARGMVERANVGGDKAPTVRDSTANGTGVAKLRISLPVKKPSESGGSATGSRVFEHRSSLGAITMTTTTAGASTGGTSATGIGIMGRQYRSTSTTSAMMMSSMVVNSRGITSEDSPTPPPLPPRKASTSSSSVITATPPGHKWIDVEAIPEMRKAPKRITAIPQKQQQQSQTPRNSSSEGTGYTIDRKETGADGQVYNYVNPEDCQCECHDHERTTGHSNTGVVAHESEMMDSSIELAEDCRPLLRSSSSSLTAAPTGTTPVVDECTADRKAPLDRTIPEAESMEKHKQQQQQQHQQQQ
ncbi:serine-rich adhesin for platelets [Anopheles maculipalpis]|uniref:serine-rich adhesin for platelets n=1 Tax=Anopheles maculipalpis TaxID=1496333 RepID=UPI002159B09E|nr:serine-rich adhesin for platelets [Anopheles maculipalpis]